MVVSYVYSDGYTETCTNYTYQIEDFTTEKYYDLNITDYTGNYSTSMQIMVGYENFYSYTCTVYSFLGTNGSTYYNGDKTGLASSVPSLLTNYAASTFTRDFIESNQNSTISTTVLNGYSIASGYTAWFFGTVYYKQNKSTCNRTYLKLSSLTKLSGTNYTVSTPSFSTSRWHSLAVYIYNGGTGIIRKIEL